MTLGAIQIVATALIVLYLTRYQGKPCPVHGPCQPAAKATGDGRLGKRAWSLASGRSVAESATPPGAAGASRLYVAARRPASCAVTGWQAMHLRGRHDYISQRGRRRA